MNQDYKTLIIYVLTLFVVVLLIVLKKQQDHMHKGLDDIRQKVNWFFFALVAGMGAIILTLVNLLAT